MGRLLNALKRLEPEMAAMQPADPVSSVDISPNAVQSSNQTAVLEQPRYPSVTSSSSIQQQTIEYPPCNDSKSACKVDGSPESLAKKTFFEVSTEFDRLGDLLDENLPIFEELTPEITLDEIENFSECEPSVLVEEPVSVISQEDSVAIEAPAGVQSETLVVEKPEPKKDQGEYGLMARNILAQLPSEGSAALFFTSPIDGEGKTELILPLAEALIEESGWRTILVDANLHRPDLTQEWQFTSRKGIFDVLTGEADWWDAVQETGLPKLSILLNNGLPQSNAIVSQPLAFSELLTNLKREYRLVLIDAASLTHDESIPMMRHCQGVYLVVRLGHSSRRTVWEASQVVVQAGGNLLGCIAVGDVLAPA
jgi:Mrp family chromosome partitioning ATPase